MADEKWIEPQAMLTGSALLRFTCAAAEGNIELAALCLEYGAIIDAIDADYSSTPLGWAARNGHRSMVAFLLQEGADAMAPQAYSHGHSLHPGLKEWGMKISFCCCWIEAAGWYQN